MGKMTGSRFDFWIELIGKSDKSDSAGVDSVCSIQWDNQRRSDRVNGHSDLVRRGVKAMAGVRVDGMTTLIPGSPLRGCRRFYCTCTSDQPQPQATGSHPHPHRALSSLNHASLPLLPSTTARPPLSASNQALLFMSFSVNSRPRRYICPLFR